MTERYVHRNNKNNEHRIVTPTIQIRSLAAYEPFRVCFSPVGSVGAFAAMSQRSPPTTRTSMPLLGKQKYTRR